jgi:dephospho-CoA kinase
VELGGGAGDGRRHWRGKPVIEAYHRAPVKVRDPDPQSPAVAASLAEMISSAVPGLRAEHVGSSAVPDLAGKGTIDLLLPTPADRVAEVAEALQAMGFQPQSVPQTFPETRPMLQGVIRHCDQPYRVHVHIVPDASPEVLELRGFRDALRSDRSLRRDYEDLKRSIVARGLTNASDFTEAKQDFIVATLRRLGFR